MIFWFLKFKNDFLIYKDKKGGFWKDNFNSIDVKWWLWWRWDNMLG